MPETLPPPSTPLDPMAGKRANWQSYEQNAAAGALKVSNKPVQLYLEITSRCNLRCVKCGFHWDPYLAKTGKDIAWPMLARMEDFFEAATEVYTFGYGEMFLYPELAPLITVLKNHHCRVSGVTNGTLIRPADVVWLVATGYDQLTFSIDGSTEETMEKLRGASHAKVMNVLRLIHEEKVRRKSELPRIVVNFVAQADNYQELPELVRQLAPLGIYFMGVNPLHHFTGDGGYHRYYQELRLGHVPKEAFEAVVAEARATAENAGILFDVFLNPAFEWPAEGIAPSTESLHIYTKAPLEADVLAEAAAWAVPEAAVPEEVPAPEPLFPILPPPASPGEKGSLPSMYCHYPWTTMYIAAAGTAKVCCYMSVFESSLGTFTGEGGLEGVWNGPGLQSVREHIRDGRVHPACAQCVVHRSYESHSAAMNPLRIELAVPPEPVPSPVARQPEPEPPAPPPPPAEPEPTGLRRILRRFHRPLTEPPSADITRSDGT